MDKRVLFVNGIFREMSISEPLGICVLASILRQNGYQNIGIYDPCIEGDCIEKAVEYAINYHPDVLAISSISTNASDIQTFISQFHSVNRESMIVIGGHGPSLCPENFMSDKIAGIFIGESEISWNKFLHAVNNGEDIYSIPGFAYMNSNNQVVINPPPKKVENLDELPFMARDTLPMLIGKYGNSVAAQMLSSRSCYMDCSYCSIKAFSKLQEGKCYRERSVGSLIAEMTYLYNDFGVRKFKFADDNFMPPNPEYAKQKVHTFCEEIVQNKMHDIHIHIQCRPDNINVELIKMLMDVGLNSLFIGAESINQEDLNLYHRIGDPQKTYMIMDELIKIGFGCDINSKNRLKVGYITFNPYSTRQTLLNSAHFLRAYKMTPKKILNILKPYYKTPIYDELNKNDLIQPDGSIRFCDPDIGELYNSIKAIITSVLSFRERIRLPIKIYNRLNVGYYSLKLDQYREMIDSLCFDAFEELLKSTSNDFEKIKQKYFMKFALMKSNADIMRDLESIETDLALYENTKMVHNIS